MKKANYIFLLSVAVCFITANAFGQTNTEKRVIEVTGSAETLITPNEFTFKITLLERSENKQKLTIEMQEAKLKEELTNLGVDVQKDLTIFDLTSVYISRKKTKDTLGTKDYRLKLKDLAKIEKLQEIADRLNIANLDLIESTHSELTRFRKETKMEALKAAKTKAEYMLGAIGERIGKSVFIQEIPDENSPRAISYGLMSNSSVTSNIRTSDSQDSETTLSFSKIKLRYAVLARFEIE
ncbi:MAG TPA: SIMPL domain-containing protein [Pyrinomonadaceae bacterium]|nr:SIMPL domain-containing protein [Pyrinomonadaceae bacterium]